MPQFNFVAIDSSGKERRGMVEAPNRELAATQIKSYGLVPARLTPVKSGSGNATGSVHVPIAAGSIKKPSYFGSAIGEKGLALFTRQLAILLQSGLSLIRSLETLIAQERNPAFKWVLSQQVDNIRAGNTFSEGLGKFPREFSRIFINMVRAGEASGTLDVSLSRLARFMVKTRLIRAKVTQASIYPVVVFSISTLIVFVLMLFVVPQFQEVFEKQMAGQELPMITQVVMGISKFVQEFWMYLIPGFFGGLFALMMLKATQPGQAFTSWLKLKTPLFRDLFLKIYISRFSRTFGTLLEGGVPILEALDFARDSVGNATIMRAIERVRNRVRDGESLAGPVAASGVFPPMVSSMLEVGEESGALPEMLSQIADIYDEEVDTAITSVTSFIEPFLIILLAAFVMAIAISIFLPFVNIMQAIGQ